MGYRRKGHRARSPVKKLHLLKAGSGSRSACGQVDLVPPLVGYSWAAWTLQADHRCAACTEAEEQWWGQFPTRQGGYGLGYWSQVNAAAANTAKTTTTKEN